MTTKLNTLTDGLMSEIRDLYSAEHQLLKALPKMESKATNKNLKAAFRAHLLETEVQVERLDEIGKLLEVKLSGKTCKAMQGLIEEGSEVMEEDSENMALLDTLLIGAAQRLEHYEIAAYSSAHAIALVLGETKVAKLLEETLEEEVKAERKLSSICKGEVLPEANLDADTDDSMSDGKPASNQKSATQRKSGSASSLLSLVASIAIGSQIGSVAMAETAQNRSQREHESATYNGDNSGRNIRDRNDSRVTADDQKMGGTEMEVLARIRQEIVANESLSTNAHNVKIIVENREVILRGPVKSAEEKAWIQAASVRTATGYNVVNQLEIAPG